MLAVLWRLPIPGRAFVFVSPIPILFEGGPADGLRMTGDLSKRTIRQLHLSGPPGAVSALILIYEDSDRRADDGSRIFRFAVEQRGCLRSSDMHSGGEDSVSGRHGSTAHARCNCGYRSR